MPNSWRNELWQWQVTGSRNNFPPTRHDGQCAAVLCVTVPGIRERPVRRAWSITVCCNVAGQYRYEWKFENS